VAGAGVKHAHRLGPPGGVLAGHTIGGAPDRVGLGEHRLADELALVAVGGSGAGGGRMRFHGGSLPGLRYASRVPLQDDYQVRLDRFQGPLDLLLFLIRRAEVDVVDIPIAAITDQYFAFLKQLDTIDIDVAGEFLVMAATLVEIKSRTLAPAEKLAQREGADAGALDETDPRFELVKQLLAYQKYRTAADELARLRAEFAQRWAVTGRGAQLPEEPEKEVELDDVHMLDLIEAYERIVAGIDLSRVGDHRVEYDDTPISLHQVDLVDRLEHAPEKRMSLQDVFTGKSRGEAIGLFLAMLELAREQKVGIRQDRINGTIEIELNLS
jgi:segregation and condensation protein A